ncbi:hypothetical protein MKW98_015447 [Papaver atlanticum]|uniref:Uncharacterized protein n=1 Tax=Papaver atlanticum TaxID=357466 RepID=A0AAD4RZF6_9MAGN|nr:hypothetical protein MKW98_015447 [Papaver atlanticum]
MVRKKPCDSSKVVLRQKELNNDPPRPKHLFWNNVKDYIPQLKLTADAPLAPGFLPLKPNFMVYKSNR